MKKYRGIHNGVVIWVRMEVGGWKDEYGEENGGTNYCKRIVLRGKKNILVYNHTYAPI